MVQLFKNESIKVKETPVYKFAKINGNLYQAVRCNSCLFCSFKLNMDGICNSVICKKEDRKDNTSIVYKLVKSNAKADVKE